MNELMKKNESSNESESGKQVELRSQLEASAAKLEEASGKLKSIDETQVTVVQNL